MSGLFQDDAPPDPVSPPADTAGGPGLFGDAAPPKAAAPIAAAPIAAEPAAAEPAAAYRVLARKYRPAGFADLIGQDAMVRTLRNAFASGRIAHAYMLTGVRGVGKTTTARIIARALNCTGPEGSPNSGPTADPCGVCADCRAILADRHPDVMEMDAASRTGVDDVREIIEATRYRPLQARTKVFVIDEVHMLSRNAFNALLKTLEEPPAHVKFIFATTELRKVPVTVLSRCQRFDLRRVGIAELAAHFARIAAQEQVPVASGALDLIARAADGSVRDGLSLLDQAIAQWEPGGDDPATAIGAAFVADMLGLADRSLVFDLLDAVMDGKPAAALAITERAHERGADLGATLADLLDLLHSLTRLKTVPGLRDSAELPEAERTRGAALADRLSVPVLARAWQMLLKGIAEVESAPDRRAAAEMVLIRLCHVADLPTPGELVRRLAAAPGGEAGAQKLPAPGGSSGGSGGGGGGGGLRAMGGAPAAMPMMAAAMPAAIPGAIPGADGVPALAPPASFRAMVALVADQREAMLHAHLRHNVHLVRYAPPVIELHPEPAAPRDLAARLSALLSGLTGMRWTIALSTAQGEPTLDEQGSAAEATRRDAAADHPLVRAILEAFPGARIEGVHDPAADAYGLTPEPPPDLPAFAPLDAEFAYDTDDDPMERDA